jgi:lipopolysaccharide/colanic/teichoic acid biosynthesis glycosyltransferase
MTAPAIHPLLWSGHQWVDRIRPQHALLKGNAYRAAKRAFDLFLVLAAAPLWVPVLVLCAAAVKLDDPRSPVFFAQHRSGVGGHPFAMHKFRTMVPDAEERKEDLWHLNELEWPDFKITVDPRVTRPGRFLRKTSLDELPQLLDVLRGTMSLVGPRPTSVSPDNHLLWQTERLDVKPGITGLWQLHGRAATLFDDRSRLDIAYIQRRTMSLDLQILIRTIPAVLSRRGAA